MLAVSSPRVRFRGWLLMLLLASTAGFPALVSRAADDQQAESGAKSAQQRLKELEEEKQLIRLFADTLEQVKSKYVESDVSDRELIEAAIQGMISRLDPYSNYISPQELTEFRKGVEREYVGIGIQVSDGEGYLQITSPLFDTPAWHAGLRAGDRILKINDTGTDGMSTEEAVKLMSGDVDTEVSITILHADESEPETVKLKREHIRQPTVIGYVRNAQGEWDYVCDAEHHIAYVQIAAFSNSTAQELRRTLTQLLQQGTRGLILDMRFNPGGILNQAIEVCDMFLHEGRIVSVEGRGTPQQTWDAQSEGTLVPRGFPVAVLVNRFSASAAEVVSACLQDNHVALVVGERTWGKGSVQTIIGLEDGHSALKLTTAGYHRPSGQNIHRQVGATEQDQWGVHPDDGYVVPYSNRDIRELGRLYDQRDALTKVRRRPADDVSAASPENGEQGPSERVFVDRQLEKALQALRDQIDSAKKNDVPAPPDSADAAAEEKAAADAEAPRGETAGAGK